MPTKAPGLMSSADAFTCASTRASSASFTATLVPSRALIASMLPSIVSIWPRMRTLCGCCASAAELARTSAATAIRIANMGSLPTGAFAPRCETNPPARFLFRLIKSGRRPAVDRNRSALDVLRPRAAEKHRKFRDVFRLAHAVLDRLLAHFGRRLAGGCGALGEKLRRAVGLGRARMDHVDVHALALAQLRE